MVKFTRNYVFALRLMNINNLQEKFRPAYRNINKHLHGTLDIFRIAIHNFGNARAAEASASMAYYTFFSIFPLILVIISFTSIVLKSQFIQDQILNYLIAIFPINPDLIISNIQNVLAKRGAVGILAFLGLIWSSTSMFNTISLNIDRAWPNSASHSFIERRIMGFLILIGLGILIVVMWLLNGLIQLEFVDRLITFLKIPIFNSAPMDFLVVFAPRGFRLLMNWVIFKWLPKAYVKPVEAFIGACFTLFFSELITLLMNWYLSSQWMRYELIYGSLGRIIALLLWIYLSSFFILFGAHICSAVSEVNQRRNITLIPEI